MDEKDFIIEQLKKENEALLKQQNELQNSIQALKQQVENFTQMLNLMRKHMYGSKSEKTSENLSGRLINLFTDEPQIFNEVEAEANPNVPDPDCTTVAGYNRRKKSKRKDRIIDIEEDVVIDDLDDDEKICNICGSPLIRIGKPQFVHDELEFIPAKLRIIKHYRYVYECRRCKANGKSHFVAIRVPKLPLDHSLASPSTLSWCIYQKYVNAVPLNRQEKDWERMGLLLSRATMANWIIACNKYYFADLVERMHQWQLKEDILHADETPYQVHKTKDKSNKSKSYMWVYTTGISSKVQIVIYQYSPTRNGDNAVKYLQDFNGYIHTDGFDGYLKLKNASRCGCWAHLRRKFVECLPKEKTKDAPLTISEIGVGYCNKLFEIEKKLADLTPEERYNKRLELEKPLLEAFWSWLEPLTILQGSNLAKAVTYAKNQKPYMMKYLEDGRCSISNNPAENAVRPFTVGRKNWLFADTPKGANASASVYSLVETAKANGLDVYKYFEYILTMMPDLDYKNNPELLDELLPWDEEVQDVCK